MNTLHLINAYMENPGGLWVFDEPRFGLKAEPFVRSATDAIDRALDRKYPGAKFNRCRILFSTKPLPDSDLVIERIGDGSDATESGCMYLDRSDGVNAELWLCPAMCHYLGNTAPAKIFATFERA
jgi:hypothetical protein